MADDFVENVKNVGKVYDTVMGGVRAAGEAMTPITDALGLTEKAPAQQNLQQAISGGMRQNQTQTGAIKPVPGSSLKTNPRE